LIQAPVTSGVEARPQPVHVRKWLELYDPLVVEQLKPEERYSIVRVGGVQYAFTSYEAHVRALHQVWAAGLIPSSGPAAVRGADLPDFAPELKGVDVDLTDIQSADVGQRRRRFS
jgi:hypothetical protein